MVLVPKQTYRPMEQDRKSTRLNSSHLVISYAVFCLKKKKIAAPPRPVYDRARSAGDAHSGLVAAGSAASYPRPRAIGSPPSQALRPTDTRPSATRY